MNCPRCSPRRKEFARHARRCPALFWEPAVYRFICPDGRSYVGTVKNIRKRNATGIDRMNTEREIKKLIEPVGWERCETVNAAEQEPLTTVLKKWRSADA